MLAAVEVEWPRPTVLIVDDNTRLRERLAVALAEAGFDVLTATNGRDALDAIDKQVPDVIVSDVKMPEVSGHEMLTVIRHDPLLRDIPVIFVSGMGETEDIVAGLWLGADDYVSKPFRMPELEARIWSKLERRPVPSDAGPGRLARIYSEAAFQAEADRELVRALRSGRPSSLAVIQFAELDRVRARLGARLQHALEQQITDLLLTDSRDSDGVGRYGEGRFALLLPEAGGRGVEIRIRRLHRLVVNHTFEVNGERLHLTPISGYAEFGSAATTEEVFRRALIAMDHAADRLDLEPVAYVPAMGDVRATDDDPGSTAHPEAAHPWHEPFRLPLQIALVHIAGVALPFVGFVLLAESGHDITPVTYLLVVATLLLTAILIWAEGFAALRQHEPPEAVGEPPPITAIIAAYLPNEAATIVETVESFLRVEYPGEVQVILAYNTPRNLPVEAILQRIARRDARFQLLRVAASTSKAQNVNAALVETTGEIVGVFDADHHPAPDAFVRAWQWIADGYDVVQGHCAIRNGAESEVARTIAVEFEVMYAVSHPGRARVYDFGIFGGSNGYWRASLLRGTRMHGFMLTEDIDSSLRTVAAGHKILSDPGLLSHELAPVTVRAMWHQRMRWAQGWFQVSRNYLGIGMRSKHLSIRQKLGLVYLLGWREIYPWLSLQMWPIIAFSVWKHGSLRQIDWLVPIFVMTSLLTLSSGPGQVIFAYLLATPEVRQNRRWFWIYLLIGPFYSEFKIIIARVAQIKELMGERQWKVTPR